MKIFKISNLIFSRKIQRIAFHSLPASKVTNGSPGGAIIEGAYGVYQQPGFFLMTRPKK